MAAARVLIILVGASVLLFSQQERIWLQMPVVSWAGEAGLKPGEVIRDPLKTGGNGPEMVDIPAGKFRMGDIQGVGGKEEQPVHEVHIAQPFAMGRYEITFEEYDQFARATGRNLPQDDGWGRGRQPVIHVSWNDAVAYAGWLSQQTGRHYRLPTEAEWEYAARAGAETAYWWGNEVKQGLANCLGCGSPYDGKRTAPVGSFKPNPFGVYDTTGNVTEWVQDCWHENYKGAPVDGSAWEQKNGSECGIRALRGGHSRRATISMRSSIRFSNRANAARNLIGFRLVREIE